MGGIYIIGIGPGDSIDYLTIKALKCINNSDVGIYVGEMIGKDIKSLFSDKEAYFSSNLTINEIKSIIENGYEKSQKIALMMPGDASLYSGQYLKQLSLAQYLEWFREQHYHYEVLPGITSWMALNAKLNIDVTQYANSNNIYITSILWQKELDQFDMDKFEKIISTNPCIILYQSYEKWGTVKIILEKYYSPQAKVIFAYKLSWHDEKIIETNLSSSGNFTNNKNFSKHTLILIFP